MRAFYPRISGDDVPLNPTAVLAFAALDRNGPVSIAGVDASPRLAAFARSRSRSFEVPEPIRASLVFVTIEFFRVIRIQRDANLVGVYGASAVKENRIADRSEPLSVVMRRRSLPRYRVAESFPLRRCRP